MGQVSSLDTTPPPRRRTAAANNDNDNDNDNELCIVAVVHWKCSTSNNKNKRTRQRKRVQIDYWPGRIVVDGSPESDAEVDRLRSLLTILTRDIASGHINDVELGVKMCCRNMPQFEIDPARVSALQAMISNLLGPMIPSAVFPVTKMTIDLPDSTLRACMWLFLRALHLAPDVSAFSPRARVMLWLNSTRDYEPRQPTLPRDWECTRETFVIGDAGDPFVARRCNKLLVFDGPRAGLVAVINEVSETALAVARGGTGWDFYIAVPAMEQSRRGPYTDVNISIAGRTENVL